MTSPHFQAADYLSALLDSLPQGRLWDKNFDSAMVQELSLLMSQFTRWDGYATGLIADSFIGTTGADVLPDWEAALGLPDPCLGVAPTLDARRAEAVARFIGLGGISVNFYIAYALNLGYPDVTITEFSPFRCDVDHTDSPLYDDFSAFLWRVNFNGATDPAVLICEITRLKPAHTFVYFDITNTLDLFEEEDSTGVILREDGGYILREY